MTEDEREVFVGEYARIVNEGSLTIGNNSSIDDFVLLNAGDETVIGDNSCIHSGSKVVGGGRFLMGDNAAVTYNCVVVTGYPEPSSHMSTCVPKEKKDTVRGTVEIGDEAFVGSNSVIMPDCEVGEGAVVAALSYVDEDVPDWTIRYPNGTTAKRDKV